MTGRARAVGRHQVGGGVQKNKLAAHDTVFELGGQLGKFNSRLGGVDCIAESCGYGWLTARLSPCTGSASRRLARIRLPWLLWRGPAINCLNSWFTGGVKMSPALACDRCARIACASDSWYSLIFAAEFLLFMAGSAPCTRLRSFTYSSTRLSKSAITREFWFNVYRRRALRK